tara:strand:- start:957 stop:1154 length:198 start_codon:yes stop_codon:yes gene_type:complete
VAVGKQLNPKLGFLGKVRNLFSISVGRYTKTIDEERKAFKAAKNKNTRIHFARKLFHRKKTRCNL